MNGYIIPNQGVYGSGQKQNIIYYQNQNESPNYQNITLDTLSNHSNKINNIAANYKDFKNDNANSNYQNTDITNTTPISRKIKKKVKFNEVVDVILVKSFKKYNKCDDEISIDDYFEENNNNKENRKKKVKNCECNII